METSKAFDGASENASPLYAPYGPDAGDAPAWEQIDTGRYKPRRIRGSFRGRELG